MKQLRDIVPTASSVLTESTKFVKNPDGRKKNNQTSWFLPPIIKGLTWNGSMWRTISSCDTYTFLAKSDEIAKKGVEDFAKENGGTFKLTTRHQYAFEGFMLIPSHPDKKFSLTVFTNPQYSPSISSLDKEDIKKYGPLREDMSAGGMSTGAIQNFDPVIGVATKKQARKYQEFDVDEDTFRKFQKGKARFERWSKYLNLQDEGHQAIYDWSKKNRSGVVILRNSATGAMRHIRRRSSNE